MWSTFSRGQAKKRSQVVAIDLGTKVTKAVSIQRRGDEYELTGFVTQEAPVSDQALTTEEIGAHLRNITQALGGKCRQVVMSIGVGDSLLRHAELPSVGVGDMRLMLKFNSKNYLQQELTDYIFDCHVLPTPVAGGENGKSSGKSRVLVGGARRQYLDHLQEAAKTAAIGLEQVLPGLAALPNAFEHAQAEAFKNEVVALVEIGFKNSTISILREGELALMRVVGIGADKITSGLAEAMGVSYAEAEGIKVGLPDEVQSALQSLLMPLGRELRASIDFFEHQADKTIGQVFVSGGSARSNLIIENLQAELMAPCKPWNPASFLRTALPPEQMANLEQTAPQLGVVIGAAMASF